MEHEFTSDGGDFSVSGQMLQQFEQSGCLMIRNLLSKEEVNHIMASLSTKEFRRHMYGNLDLLDAAREAASIWNEKIFVNMDNLKVDDGKGMLAHMAIWNKPGNDVTGMVARSEKVAGSCERLLGGEVYHYHSKLMGKPPREGGRHVWHQDYGYWYYNGCMFPDMITVFVAMDKCEKANGCLQYLPGSHRCGRVDHHKLGGQYEADPDRVTQIMELCPLQYAEMEPGDVLFMHCNVLHSSSRNGSDFRRWALLCCYNLANNNPTKVHHHSQYTPLIKVKNADILACTNMSDEEGKSFMPSKDDTTSFLKTVGKRIYED